MPQLIQYYFQLKLWIKSQNWIKNWICSLTKLSYWIIAESISQYSWMKARTEKKLLYQIGNNFSLSVFWKKYEFISWHWAIYMTKIFEKYKRQTFLTFGHHHPDDDLVSRMFGFYLFNIFSLFFKPKQTLWTVISILVPVSP